VEPKELIYSFIKKEDGKGWEGGEWEGKGEKVETEERRGMGDRMRA
jgi:hypothetical protein